MQKNVAELDRPHEYGSCALHTAQRRLQTLAQYLLCFQGNSGFMNAPQCLYCYFTQLVAPVSTAWLTG
jgi:hypothetical protein